MKSSFLFATLFAVLCCIPTACSDNDDALSDSLPDGALPSEELTLGNFTDEAYAEHAICLQAQESESSAPFYTLELMGDGYYMLNKSRSGGLNQAPSVVKASIFGIAVHAKSKMSRSVLSLSADGTVFFSDGSVYGKYTLLGNNRYHLSNGATLDLTDLGSTTESITYTYADGTSKTCTVYVAETVSGNATKSLCRTWNLNTVEDWIYFNNIYAVHAKETIQNGRANVVASNPYDLDLVAFGIDSDGDPEACYKVVFTPSRTYICFYLDGTTDIMRWSWQNQEKGILHFEDFEGNEDYDEDYEGDVTVRFAGKQMRIYEDYSFEDYHEDFGDMTLRLVGVSTLTAAN